MVTGAPVTCSSCRLKYLALPDGTCPRCHAAQPAPLPAEGSNPVGGQRRSLTPLVWIGGAVVVLAGVAAAWSLSQGGERAGECRRVIEISTQGRAAVKSIMDASKKRGAEPNETTVADVAKELDKTANDLDSVSLTDPLLITAVEDHTAALRRLAEQGREEIVTSRVGDSARMRKLADKRARAFDEDSASFGRVATLCGLQPPSDERTP